MNFQNLLEENQLGEALFAELNNLLSETGVMLREGTLIDATIIEAPTSTKNKSGKRDPDMHQNKKDNEWYFGMKVRIDVDAVSGLTHQVVITPATTPDITEAEKLLHNEEDIIIADAGHSDIEKREEHQNRTVNWAIAERPGKLKELKKKPQINALSIELEKAKAADREAVEYPFRIIKCQFGFTKTRYRGLKKNHNKLVTLFALVNIVRLRLLVKN